MVIELPYTEAYAPMLFKLRLAGISLLLLCAIAYIAGRVISKRITGPIIELRDMANRIGEGKLDTETRLLSAANNEINDLATSFNQMIQALKSTTVSRDILREEIKEREKIEAALKKRRYWQNKHRWQRVSFSL